MEKARYLVVRYCFAILLIAYILLNEVYSISVKLRGYELLRHTKQLAIRANTNMHNFKVFVSRHLSISGIIETLKNIGAFIGMYLFALLFIFCVYLYIRRDIYRSKHR